MRHAIAKFVKQIIYRNGENYSFSGNNLRFVVNTRPVLRKYADHPSDVVRNDVLQINYLEQVFKPEHVLWDIGAHWGHYAIFGASVAKGNGQVFAFEPDRSARTTMEANLALNGFQEKVRVFDLVIGGVDGAVEFLDMGGNANSHIVKEGKEGGTITKQAKTLDSLLDELPRPDFVKIDTEGAEIDILKKGSKLLQDKNVRFICELHPFAWDDFGVRYQDFLDLVQASGRNVQLLDSRKSEGDLPFYGTVLF